MPKTEISVLDHRGLHNTEERARKQEALQAFRNLSTVFLIVTRGLIPAKVVQAQTCLLRPMNQRVTSCYVINAEVGAAYEDGITAILNDEAFTSHDWKYVLTMEEDNMPPPDGLLKLYESIAKGYDVVGGLYWGKGEHGQPMVYGDPNEHPRNYRPIYPPPNSLVECNGLGMGFTLFSMDIFKNPKWERPFFKTQAERVGKDSFAQSTQDLYFFTKAAQLGYRFAVDTSVLVGHYDYNSQIVW